MAAVLHGRLRTTADLDLVVELEDENAERAVTALQAVGFRRRAPWTLESLADASQCRSWFDQGLPVVSLRTPAHRAFEVDLFLSEPFDFGVFFTRAIQVTVGSTHAFIPASNDLLAMERVVGRGQDLDDVAALEALRGWAHRSREDGFDREWERHARRQACLGLELSASERLQWLESTMREMREILGAADRVTANPRRGVAVRRLRVTVDGGMLDSIEEVLAALNQADVRYLVVGGVAVLLHGHLRPIAGLDLVVQLEPQNAVRAIGVLGALGFKPRVLVPVTTLADAAARRKWSREKGLTVLSFWSPSRAGFEVGLRLEEPFDFEAAFNRAHKLPLGSTHAQVPSLTDLIGLQRATGRPEDLEDVAALEALRASQGQREAPPVAKIRDTYAPRSPP